jgi:hypothetical protein
MYGDRLARAVAHARQADGTAAAMRRLRDQEKTTRRQQAAHL